MSEADLKINSKVRKILTENNLDLSLLSVSCTSGAVRIKGELRRLSRSKMSDRETARLLGVLDTLILHTKGIKRVDFSIENWKKTKGKWREVEK